MEKRLDKLEADVSAMKIDIAILKAHSATKADVAEAKSAIILWMVSAIFFAQLLPAFAQLFLKA